MTTVPGPWDLPANAAKAGAHTPSRKKRFQSLLPSFVNKTPGGGFVSTQIGHVSSKKVEQTTGMESPNRLHQT